MFLYFVLHILAEELEKTLPGNILKLKKGTEITCKFSAVTMDIEDENTVGKNVFFIPSHGFGGFKGAKFILNTVYALKHGTETILNNKPYKLDAEVEILLKDVEVVLKDQNLDIFSAVNKKDNWFCNWRKNKKGGTYQRFDDSFYRNAILRLFFEKQKEFIYEEDMYEICRSSLEKYCFAAYKIDTWNNELTYDCYFFMKKGDMKRNELRRNEPFFIAEMNDIVDWYNDNFDTPLNLSMCWF